MGGGEEGECLKAGVGWSQHLGQQKELVWVGVDSNTSRPAHWPSRQSRIFLVEGSTGGRKYSSFLPGASEGQSVGHSEKHSVEVRTSCSHLDPQGPCEPCVFCSNDSHV